MNTFGTGDDPRHREAFAALESGRPRDAIAAFERELASGPGDGEAFFGLSLAKLAIGDAYGAFDAAKQATMAAPGSVRMLLPLGPAAFSIGDETAANFCLDVLRQIPAENARRLAEFWVEKLVERDRFADAATVLSALANAHGETLAERKNRAGLYVSAGRAEAARPIIERIARDDAAEGRYLSGRLHLQSGDLDAARADAQAASRDAPDDVRFIALLAEIDAGAVDAAMQETLGARLNDENADAQSRVAAGAALGAVRERAGDHPAAFASFAAASRIARDSSSRAGRGYDPANVEALVHATAERAGLAPAPGGARGRDLIFIIGLPRSGSTLIDQILAAHSRVASAGETSALADVYQAIIARAQKTGADFVATIDSGAAEWEARYRRAIAATGAQREIIVDKSLQNFWLRDLIARLFPAARVIRMERDPMDVGLSIFRHLYFGAHAYANDLADLGHHIACHQALAVRWRALYDDIEVDYETFVADFDAGLARLLADCGLAMEAGCRDFSKAERPVLTLSATQVRRGLMQGRAGRWRRYERELAPLNEALRATSVKLS